MQSWSKPTSETVERALSLSNKDSVRHRFFSRLENPNWIQPLFQLGCFSSPPGVKHLPDGYVQYPPWPELLYLKNVTKKVPEEVVDIISDLPQTDNPNVYDGVLDIALMLKGEQSVRLKPKMIEYADLRSYLLPNKFADLLAHWTAENETQATLELAKMLVRFYPDPRDEEKRGRHAENSQDDDLASMDTFLEPAPRFDDWNYHEIMDKGVRPLAEKEPYEVACILIKATANMICLGKHQSELDSGTKSDFSELSCPKLDEQILEDMDTKQTLILTMTYACEKVFENGSCEEVEVLNDTLMRQRWNVFERLRQHLYAIHPSEQTRPWIRELIVDNDNFAKDWTYPYEFQRMIRKSCENLGTTLLTKSERAKIFDLILSDSVLKARRNRMGDQYTEAKLEQWKRKFYRSQFRPFASVLFGKYTTYLDSFDSNEEEDSITDDTYFIDTKPKASFVETRSPKSSDELSEFSDEELLCYINEWQDEHSDENDWSVQVVIPSLADAFQTVFIESIVPDDSRLKFWLQEKRDRIKRPIYVRYMIKAIQTQVEAGVFGPLDAWFEFCTWAVSQNQENDTHYVQGDTSPDNPNWRPTKQAVGEFVEKCLTKEANVPISFRNQLAELLKALCTQSDKELDNGVRTLLDRNDPLTEAINHTRSRALETLIKYGYWVRVHDQESELKEVKCILAQRFKTGADFPLTVPEYAMLGRNFIHIVNFDKTWTITHKSCFFPQDDMPAWRAAFSSFLIFTKPYNAIFETVRGDFSFALNKLDCMDQKELLTGDVVASLGKHLFNYYIWDMYPLVGTDSLLDHFYQKTNEKRWYWGRLFDHVGRLLRNTNTQLEESLKSKVTSFFEWRLKIGEPSELRDFTCWLDAECLETDWRLDAYSRILDVPEVLYVGLGERQEAYLHIKSLRSMLPEYLEHVLPCFEKLIHAMPEDGLVYIPADDAKAILKAGRNHNDEIIRKTAERIRDTLLRRGQLEFLDLDD